MENVSILVFTDNVSGGRHHTRLQPLTENVSILVFTDSDSVGTILDYYLLWRIKHFGVYR